MAILVIMWLYRATKNLSALGVLPRYGPGWAIGGWFVPIVSFFIPKKMVNDAWRAGRTDDEPPDWLHVWWGLWIVLSLMTNAGGRGVTDSADLSKIQQQDQLDIAIGVIAIVAGLLLIRVIRDVTRRQDARHAEGPVQVPRRPPQNEIPVTPGWEPSPEYRREFT